MRMAIVSICTKPVLAQLLLLGAGCLLDAELAAFQRMITHLQRGAEQFISAEVMQLDLARLALEELLQALGAGFEFIMGNNHIARRQPGLFRRTATEYVADAGIICRQLQPELLAYQVGLAWLGCAEFKAKFR